MKIGKRIQDLRIEFNLTEEELAKKLDVFEKVVKNWEEDIYKPDKKMLKKIAFVFGINLKTLTHDTELESAYENNTNILENKTIVISFLGIIYFVIGVIFYFLPFYSYKSTNWDPINFSTIDIVVYVKGFNIIFSTDNAGLAQILCVFFLWIGFLSLFAHAAYSVLGIIFKGPENDKQLGIFSLVTAISSMFIMIYAFILLLGTARTPGIGIILLLILFIAIAIYQICINKSRIKEFVVNNKRNVIKAMCIFIALLILFSIM